MDIEKLVNKKKANVAVIGLGYVGLPLSLVLASRGFKTIGLDRDKNKVTLLNSKILPIAKREPRLKELLKSSQENFKAMLIKENTKADIFIIVVNTAVDRFKKPINEPILSATDYIARNLDKGNLVIIESTVAPFTTKNLLIPELEKKSGLKVNRDFFVAVCPERIRPNHVIEQLTTFPRVIGGSSLTSAKIAKSFYKFITAGALDITDTTTAETVKTVENASRDLQIAFANEMALLCEKLGVNVWEVRNLVNKDPFKTMLKPGAGVGGHCLPEDPWLLFTASGKTSKLIPLGRKINDHMPAHVFSIIKKVLGSNNISTKNAELVILGYAYSENSDDSRNSPTEKLMNILDLNKIKYTVHDPYIEKYNKPIDKLVKNADCLVFMVSHGDYKKINLKRIVQKMRSRIIIDGRNCISKEKAEDSGFLYKGIGNV